MGKHKLNIMYSGIYDQTLHKLMKKRYGKNQYRNGLKYARWLQKKWDKLSGRAFKTISQVSGLKWKKPAIDCYVAKHSPYSFSMPMTIKMNKNFDHVKEVVIHELIHNIIVQNIGRVSGKSEIFHKYRKENYTTQIHILVHAILNLVLERLFGKSRTKKYIKRYKWKDYKRAWEIVEKEGAENIIKKTIR